MTSSTKISFKWKPKYLVLSGGGAKGFFLPGIVSVLDEYGFLDQIEAVAGTSIGAVFAFLWTVGFTGREIVDWVSCIDFKILSDNMNLSNLLTKGSVGDLKFMKDIMSEFLEIKKLESTISFAEVEKKFHKKLYINAVCYETGEHIIFNPDDYPDFPVIDAVIASCSLPGVFNRYVYKDKSYLDGGVIQAYLIHLFPWQETLGILLSKKYGDAYKVYRQKQKETKEVLLNRFPVTYGIAELLDNLTSSFYIMMDEMDRSRMKLHADHFEKTKQIRVNPNSVHSLSFMMNKASQMALVIEGMGFALEFICRELFPNYDTNNPNNNNTQETIASECYTKDPKIFSVPKCTKQMNPPISTKNNKKKK